ncbi:hypothetical protein Tco_0332957 [Tanacetum coccineum]
MEERTSVRYDIRCDREDGVSSRDRRVGSGWESESDVSRKPRTQMERFSFRTLTDVYKERRGGMMETHLLECVIRVKEQDIIEKVQSMVLRWMTVGTDHITVTILLDNPGGVNITVINTESICIVVRSDSGWCACDGLCLTATCSMQSDLYGDRFSFYGRVVWTDTWDSTL